MYGARVGHLVGVPVVHELPGVRDAVHDAVRAQLALALVEPTHSNVSLLPLRGVLFRISAPSGDLPHESHIHQIHNNNA